MKAKNRFNGLTSKFGGLVTDGEVDYGLLPRVDSSFTDQEVRVVDNSTEEDVTTPTLTQIILEEGRGGGSRALPAALLHELVRLGGRRLRRRVDQVQNGASSLLQAALERWTPVREARAELDLLHDRLAELEAILARLEVADANGREPVTRPIFQGR